MSLRPRNRDGTPVDPVPFLVVALTAFLITHAWGPLYLRALGFSVVTAVTILTALLVAIVTVAYHRLVWTVYPDGVRVATPGQRLSYLLYAVAIGIAVVALLLIPFLAPQSAVTPG